MFEIQTQIKGNSYVNIAIKLKTIIVKKWIKSIENDVIFKDTNISTPVWEKNQI